MKVVICADVHLDSTFQESRNNLESLAMRREDSRKTFSRVIQRTQETQAHLLLIAGDLFDANKVSEETLTFIKEKCREIPDTYVFISPGNNDPATPFSPYRKEGWPENVYIFTGGLEAVELSVPETQEAVRIYGAAFQGQHTPAPLLNANQIPELDSGYINILLMHASMKDGSLCNPISEDLLDQCGFDFCVLGHQHQGSGVVTLSNTFYAYPGTCESRNFDEAGGILTGTIAKNQQDLTTERISSRQYLTECIEITELHTHEEIIQAIRVKCPETQHIYRVTLTGTPHPMLKLSLKNIKDALAEYFSLRLRTNFSAALEEARPLKTGRIEDYFLSEAGRAASENVDPEILRLSIQYGLAALESQDAMEKVFSGEEFASYED